jgi:glutathione S-transferase
VLQALKGDLGAGEAQVHAWLARWMGEGLAALETMVARWGQGFAYGDAPGLVECCLVPQLYAARRFGVGLEAWPRLVEIDARCATCPLLPPRIPQRKPMRIRRSRQPGSRIGHGQGEGIAHPARSVPARWHRGPGLFR